MKQIIFPLILIASFVSPTISEVEAYEQVSDQNIKIESEPAHANMIISIIRAASSTSTPAESPALQEKITFIKREKRYSWWLHHELGPIVVRTCWDVGKVAVLKVWEIGVWLGKNQPRSVFL